jgi:predicted phage tail protein
MDSSGIGNKPYVIDLNNTDRYPLTEPFNSTFFALQITPPKISIETPLNQTFKKSNVTLFYSIDVLSANKSVNWVGYCLDDKQNVTLTNSGAISNFTIAYMTAGLHTVTVYANDTYGNIGSSETFTFQIKLVEPFPTTTVVVTLGVTAIVIGVGLIVYFKKYRR